MSGTNNAPTDIAAAAERVNILIVDDEPKNLLVLETVLDDPVYNLIRASSGEEALSCLMAHEFAVLVLDVRMPGMTGFELAQIVKERKKTALVPIIFLTAYFNEDQHILEGYGSGAVDYLHKPVNAAVLRSKVAIFAEFHRKSRALEVANRALLAEIGERRRAEAQLNTLNDTLDRRVTERTNELQIRETELHEAASRKDEFLAMLAHELRNPLAPVRNAIHVLQVKGQLSPEVHWATVLIDRQVRAMSRLIDDLMDVSRINQGKIELRRECLDLTSVMRDAVETTLPVVEESGHQLTLAPCEEQFLVDGDRARLAQAFTNLLNNACKYMDPGGRIELAMQGDGNAVEVTVRDTGIGIAPERLGDVFDMFTQVETALTRSRGGLGVGLSLTRKLIELHGGTVVARSAGLGHGSQFVVRLPLAVAGQRQAAEDTDGTSSQNAAKSRRVLIADDNQDSAETMSALLELYGHVVCVARDGEEALAAAQAFEPDVVILDIGMPKLNGYDCCRKIRALPGGDTRTVVAVTGWGQPDDRLKSSEAGFDMHLVKPVDPEALVALLSHAGSQPCASADQGG